MAETSITLATQSNYFSGLKRRAMASGLSALVRRHAGRRFLITELEDLPVKVQRDIGGVAQKRRCTAQGTVAVGRGGAVGRKPEEPRRRTCLGFGLKPSSGGSASRDLRS